MRLGAVDTLVICIYEHESISYLMCSVYSRPVTFRKRRRYPPPDSFISDRSSPNKGLMLGSDSDDDVMLTDLSRKVTEVLYSTSVVECLLFTNEAIDSFL